MLNKPHVISAILISTLSITALNSPAQACYWDRDTLTAEKRRFPKVFELITGAFKRRSPEFYQWRIKDRRARLASTPDDLRLLDDLAVALDKVGEHQEAAEVMQRALTLNSDRYETHANLGTIYIHSKRFQEGLKHIERALEINPKAHFGREVIQLELVRYVLKVRAAAKARSAQGDQGELPLFRNESKRESRCRGALDRVVRRFNDLSRITRFPAGGDDLSCPPLKELYGFAAHLKAREISIKDGLKGVMGMMRFSNHEHPILLEVLGDLLIADRWEKMGKTDAKQLAARAYISASRHTEGKASARYSAKAVMAMAGTFAQISYRDIERAFIRELKRGDRIAQRHMRRERRLIKRGKSPE